MRSLLNTPSPSEPRSPCERSSRTSHYAELQYSDVAARISGKRLVGTGRFELPACRLGGGRSIHLSYVPAPASLLSCLSRNLLIPKWNRERTARLPGIDFQCDAKMCHMTKASVRDLRYGFKRIERLLREGEEIQITNRRRIVARLIPESADAPAKLPDFLKRLRATYGDKILPVTGADLIAEDRSRY